MRTYPSSVLNLLEEGCISIRGLMRFDFGTGTYGFIKSNQPFTYDGLTYQPGGIISVSDFASEIGLTAQKFVVTLAASPDDGLTPEVLQTIENEDYRDRPVTFYDAFFHPDTNELLHVEAMKRGYADTIDHVTSRSLGYAINVNCESRALDYTRTNGRKRSDTDQRRRSLLDEWFINASRRGREEIFWGKDKPISANQGGSNEYRGTVKL